MRRAMTCALGIVLAVGLQACGQDAEKTDASTPPVEKFTLAGCHAMIPDSVAVDLGWSALAAPVPETSVQTCTAAAPEGTVTVERQLVGGADYDDVAVAAEKVFTDTCAVLDSDPAVDATGEGEPATSVDWLGADVPACAVTRGFRQGASILLAQPTKYLVVQVEVQPGAETDPAAVQSALVDLQRAAAAHLGEGDGS